MSQVRTTADERVTAVEAMAWWLIPIVATLLAVAWVSWRGRPRRPVDPHQSLAAHRRFTEAMSHAAPVPHAPQVAVDADPAEDHSELSQQTRRSA